MRILDLTLSLDLGLSSRARNQVLYPCKRGIKSYFSLLIFVFKERKGTSTTYIERYRARAVVCDSIISFFYFVRRLIFNKAQRLGRQLCFRFQVKKAPTLVDALDIAILSHGASN